LAFLLLFVVASLLIHRRDVWSTVAQVVLIFIAAFMIVGALGEGLAGSTPDVPRGVQIFSGLWGTIAGALLAGLCARSILTSRRTRQAIPASSGS
jgi:hypothetical protein